MVWWRLGLGRPFQLRLWVQPWKVRCTQQMSPACGSWLDRYLILLAWLSHAVDPPSSLFMDATPRLQIHPLSKIHQSPKVSPRATLAIIWRQAPSLRRFELPCALLPRSDFSSHFANKSPSPQSSQCHVCHILVIFTSDFAL